MTASLCPAARLTVVERDVDHLSEEWRDMLEAGESFADVCLDSPSEIDGVVAVLSDADTGERIVAAGCHPTSRLEVADLLALVGSATAGTPPQWKPLLDRRNILSRARLLHLGSHLMVLRLEMCFRSVRLRPAG